MSTDLSQDLTLRIVSAARIYDIWVPPAKKLKQVVCTRSAYRFGARPYVTDSNFVAILISSASQHRRRLVCRRLSRLAVSVSSPSSSCRRLDLVAVLIPSLSWHRRHLGRQSSGRVGFVAVFIA